jgi:N6-L-threonylcarbamoyladenine synthase
MSVVLGIESTAHTFGVGIVKDGKVIANVRDMYTTETGGIIPIESAKHHARLSHELYNKSLAVAGIKEKDIDAIAFSQGPGLAPCLIEGMKFAKEISIKLKKPIVGVNHCVSHLEIGKITGAKDPVMLYASGANTQVIAYESGKYRVFGETLDIGVGNFIDNFARFSGIGFPGGPAIEKLAKQGKNYIELPYKVKGMDITLSGILTNLKQKVESKKYSIEDLSYSLQETVFAMLVETAERALAHTGKNELLLGGGVACNSRLQEMCKIMCEERTSSFGGSSKSQTEEKGAKFFCPERSLLVDNGAMIAFLGEIMFKAKSNLFSEKELNKIDIYPTERTDDINVDWK